jgi:hypothetical protein
MSWHQADEACKSMGGRLPEIFAQLENDFLVQIKVSLMRKERTYFRHIKA